RPLCNSNASGTGFALDVCYERHVVGEQDYLSIFGEYCEPRRHETPPDMIERRDGIVQDKRRLRGIELSLREERGQPKRRPLAFTEYSWQRNLLPRPDEFRLMKEGPLLGTSARDRHPLEPKPISLPCERVTNHFSDAFL